MAHGRGREGRQLQLPVVTRSGLGLPHFPSKRTSRGGDRREAFRRQRHRLFARVIWPSSALEGPFGHQALHRLARMNFAQTGHQRPYRVSQAPMVFGPARHPGRHPTAAPAPTSSCADATSRTTVGKFYPAVTVASHEPISWKARRIQAEEPKPGPCPPGASSSRRQSTWPTSSTPDYRRYHQASVPPCVHRGSVNDPYRCTRHHQQ